MTVQIAPPVNTPPPTPPRTPPPNNGGRLPRLDTLLGRFQLLAFVTTLLAIAALVICFLILSATTSNFRELVTKITPSINAAQRLGQALEEMDANAADYQLTSRIDVTSPDLNAGVYGASGFRATAWNNLEERRRRVDNALAIARTKARYPGEDDAINRISNRFYDYFAQIRLMRYELDLGRKEAALANYKVAEDILVGNLGNAERDANGNSREKILKDNNWGGTGGVSFTCVTNCAAGTQGVATKIIFDMNTSYDGIAANIHKLSEINLKKSVEIGGVSGLNSLVVFIAAGLVVVLGLIISVYYTLITHRVINIGFALAVIGGIAVAGLLVANLGAATQDYDRFSKQFIGGISTASAIQQLSAGASADISRLLLSPDSPGLDSTSPALTSDVKQAFGQTNLRASYENKRKQVEIELNNLWILADTAQERTELCKVISNPNQNCGSSTFSWTKFTTEATNINKKFDQKLLADAILINIVPKATQTQTSAREPYIQFSDSINKIADINKTAFDQRACAVIGSSEFGNSCGGDTGYLNQLQVIIWIAFPLLSLLVAGGVWFASREF